MRGGRGGFDDRRGGKGGYDDRHRGRGRGGGGRSAFPPMMVSGGGVMLDEGGFDPDEMLTGVPPMLQQVTMPLAIHQILHPFIHLSHFFFLSFFLTHLSVHHSSPSIHPIFPFITHPYPLTHPPFSHLQPLFCMQSRAR